MTYAPSAQSYLRRYHFVGSNVIPNLSNRRAHVPSKCLPCGYGLYKFLRFFSQTLVCSWDPIVSDPKKRDINFLNRMVQTF